MDVGILNKKFQKELLPVSVLFDFLLVTATMHLAKIVGKWHGRYAKYMLAGK